MSEYQYYEFQAIDRPLDAEDRQALRALSTRARITATSFTNSYHWGDFKGNPMEMMKHWFDLHFYVANWGSFRLMIRWPARLVDRAWVEKLLDSIDCAEMEAAGDHLILDIATHDESWDDMWEEDGADDLAVLVPLRADVLNGDLRLFYLLWLHAVAHDSIADDGLEPLPGLGDMTAPLRALAEFLRIDPDLVAAASEQAPGGGSGGVALTDSAVKDYIKSLPAQELPGLLAQLVSGEPHVAAELRKRAREHLAANDEAAHQLRTAGWLRTRAQALRAIREQAEAEQAAAERKRQAEAAEKVNRTRRQAIASRGDAIWDKVEAEIGRINLAGYQSAAELLLDLRVIADERGTRPDFDRRLAGIRTRHARKGRFLECLAATL